MKRIYAPWRSSYISDTARAKQEEATQHECLFCKQFKQKKDDQNFILKRFKHTIILLNRFPYNAGHLLIMPIKHTSDLSSLSKEARAELMELITQSATIVERELKADGINIGLNLGKASGAGIPSHLHFHVLPRWSGDTNFLPTLAHTKQISFDLSEMYKQLKKAFK